MPKRLIFNADDFGLTRGINRGIIKAFREGIVRSASLMPVGATFEDAAGLARDNPGLDIGVHLCLTEEKPLLAGTEIPSIVTKEGYFLKTPARFVLRYARRRLIRADIERELDAQIRRVFDAGITPTHIDSHGYIHMLPMVLKVVIELSKRYNILYLRYPYEHTVASWMGLSRSLPRLSLALLCLFLKQPFRHQGVLYVNNFSGFSYSGHLSEKNLKGIFRKLASGDTEVVCHPGVGDADCRRYAYWGYAWEEELKTLTSAAIKNSIRDSDIELISFKDILP